MAKFADVGLQSEELREALEEALGSETRSPEPRRLDALLARHGGLPSPHPNTKLAAAFGEEAATHGRDGLKLALRLSRTKTGEHDPAEFLPVAAAFALVALIRKLEREPAELDAGLFALAADERSSVRVGTIEALTILGTRDAAGLLARANDWLDAPDREMRYQACGSVIDALSDPHVLSEAHDPEGLLAYLDRAIEEIVQAPRAAERSPARRRALTALAHSLAAVVPATRGGIEWMRAHCETAEHEDLRDMLERALERLRRGKLGSSDVATLHDALESSKKPPRDPTRDASGARGRGRKGKRRGR